jgi:hypothetical protein
MSYKSELFGSSVICQLTYVTDSMVPPHIHFSFPQNC